MRPRLCAVCHTDADWALQVQTPTCNIKRDGTLRRGKRWTTTFYCVTHLGLAQVA